MRGTDWLAARGIARMAVGVGVVDIQDGERRSALDIASRSAEARYAARAEAAVPLVGRANALRRNAL